MPLGALQSINIENLYGAGRIVSSDKVAFAAIRVMGTCFTTGHAAGVTAAYQALNGNV
ncbi:FAD-dependent oxidoreductase [Fusobacterium polymorphum]